MPSACRWALYAIACPDPATPPAIRAPSVPRCTAPNRRAVLAPHLLLFRPPSSPSVGADRLREKCFYAQKLKRANSQNYFSD